MRLYRGTAALDDPVEPAVLAEQGYARHFTPYRLVAMFYGMRGRVATYETDEEIQWGPHSGDPTTSPPLSTPVANYEAVLTSEQIAQLRLVHASTGRLLPGTRVFGPDGDVVEEEPGDLPRQSTTDETTEPKKVDP